MHVCAGMDLLGRNSPRKFKENNADQDLLTEVYSKEMVLKIHK